jgi:glutamate-5-semialdehyde dehydrogenase
MQNFEKIFTQAKKASQQVAALRSDEKNTILNNLAEKLQEKMPEILEENAKDIKNAEKLELGDMIDRLLLTPERITSMAAEVKKVASLHDFVGEKISRKKMDSQITIEKVRVPLGVVAMIYESRPNVTIDAGSLAFKSGNAIILKGGKEAEYSNQILEKIFREVLEEFSKISGKNITNAVQLIKNASREDTAQLLKAKGKIDLLIPRGGKGLIKFVAENSLVPVIETGASVVHTFVDESANFEMAKNIVINEKTRRVSVCNALDTLLIHERIAENFLEYIVPELEKAKVTPHFAERPLDSAREPEKRNEDIFTQEYLSYDLSIQIVKDIDEALEHIEKYSLGHSESIVTEDEKNAEKFLHTVDAACVYHNVSTAFSDGAQFGLGAEIGISTQKLHARGPFALEALTSYKWIITGDGITRK